tara:strand:- start:109 stop:837 length:729 start_codon:yes stop_codon:yes gene_type:complete
MRRIITFIKKILYPPNPNNRFVNIGGGKWYFPRWENVDFYAPKVYVDYRLDLRTKRKLNIKSNTASIVYSSHFFEHISDSDCKFILKESYRILKKNGTIRISVPDMDLAFNAYFNDNLDFFQKEGVSCHGDNIEEHLINFFASYATSNYRGGPKAPQKEIQNKLNSLNKYDFCKWCVSLIPDNAPYKAHVNAYDFNKLQKYLKDTGFINIIKSDYQKSNIAVLRNKAFDNRPKASLFIEAQK